jgi:hypothetical protein
MNKILTKLFALVGKPIMLVTLLLIFFGPGHILAQFSHSILVYVIAYLLLFYAPAIIDAFYNRREFEAFSMTNIKRGLVHCDINF